MERQSNRRRRPPLACTQCRRRKVRCDRSKPCANCTTAKIQCCYKVYQPKSPQHRQDQIESPFSLETYSSNSVLSAPPVNESSSATNSLNHTSEVDIALNSLSQRISNVEEKFIFESAHEGSQDVGNLLLVQFNTQDAQIRENKTRILRWNHWAGAASEFNNIIACYEAIIASDREDAPLDGEHSILLREINQLLEMCKRTARVMKTSRPSRSLYHTQQDFTPPAREFADAMVNLYFQHFESVFRILHRTTFNADYDIFWHNPAVARADLRLMILLVIAIGSSLSNHNDSDTLQRGTIIQWVYAAQNWLSGPLEKDRLEIAGIQIYCLTILARQIFSIGGDLIWMSMGSLLHCAMQTGMHRNSRYFPAMSELNKELRKRLWATILEMLVQSSLDSSMPPQMSIDSFDVESPSNVDDEAFNQATLEVVSLPRDNHTQTSMQLVLLDSLPVRLRVVQLLNGVNANISYTDVLDLSKDLTEACHRLNRFSQEHKDSVSAFHRDLLDYLVRRFLIPLHCPFSSRARTNPMFSYSTQVSLDTALALTSPDLDHDFSRLMAMGGGMFKEGFRCASTVISMRLVAQTEAQRLEGTLSRIIGSRDHLKRSMNHLISLAVLRIRQGETNVKSHMFLSMLQAKVEALERDRPAFVSMLLSAKSSVEFCYDLLCQQVDPANLASPDLGLGAERDHDVGLDFFLVDTDLF